MIQPIPSPTRTPSLLALTTPARHRSRLRSKARPGALGLALCLALGATPTGCAAPDDPAAAAGEPPPTNAQLDQRFAEAERLLRAGQPIAALDITDELIRYRPDDPEVYVLAAEGNLLLAKQRPGNAYELRYDASQALERALEHNAGDPGLLLALARTQFDLGDFDLAIETADRAVEGFAGRAQRTQQADAEVVAAEAALQRFVAARQQEFDDPGELDPSGNPRPAADTSRLAAETLRRYAALKERRPEIAWPRSADVYQWLSRPQETLGVLEAGVRQAPQVAKVHVRYQDLLWQTGDTRTCLGTYRNLVGESPGVELLRFYLGRALVARADELRAAGDWDSATAHYEEAKAEFAAFRRSTENGDAGAWYQAACQLAIARGIMDRGDLDGAREAYAEAWRINPRVLDRDRNGLPRILDSFGGNYEGGLSILGQRLQDREPGLAGLRTALAFHRDVLARHPQVVTFLNNAALTARDLGEGIAALAEGGERVAALEEAMALHEEAYGWYQRAVALAPTDARLLNDCALMLVYYLKRDLDRAVELLREAIRVGDKALASLGREADDATRNDLEESVGDAWQNLARMAYDQGRPFDEYRPLLEKAVTYYPYRERAAARTLRQGGGWVPRDSANRWEQLRLQQDPTKAAALRKAMAEAQPMADAGDYDGALRVMDKAGKELRGYGPYHAAAGQWNLAYALQARDQGGSGGLVSGLFHDAKMQLQAAVAAGSTGLDVHRALLKAAYESLDHGVMAEAVSAIEAALATVRLEEPEMRAVQAEMAGALRLIYVDKKQNGADAPEVLAKARGLYRELAENGALSTAQAGEWSVMEEWAGNPTAAVEVLIGAVQRNPQDFAAWDTLIPTAARLRQSQAVLDAFAGSKDATVLFYRGKAGYNDAVQKWLDQELDAAIAAADKALVDFEASAAANPDYRDSCEQWRALTLGMRGWVHFGREDLAAAQADFLASLRLRPELRTTQLNGEAFTTKSGIQYIDVKLRGERGKRMEQLELLKQASAAAPDDLEFANNLGLLARDIGEARKRRGETEGLAELFELSITGYNRAVKVAPDDVRILNDTALILVHHLEREWDRSRQLLDRGIQLGVPELAAMPEGTDGRQGLDEALGDCYENLALWHIKHSRDLDAAQQAAEQSMEHHPGRRRPGARRYLQVIERLRSERKQEGEGGDDR